MKVEKREGGIERQVLIGMLVNDTVLARVASTWHPGMFASRWSNIVANWAIDHHRKYEKAPGKDIRGYFDRWAENNRDTDTVELAESFISSLSNEYSQSESISVEYIIDLAGQHFNKIRILKLADDLQADVDVGELDKAISRVTTFNRVEMGAGSGVDLFNDREAVMSTFSQGVKDVLIHYPSALGSFFQDTLERDGFVCFVGPQKSGKSWWLIDLAWRAMIKRRKVAFFEIGDLSEWQIKERFLTRAARSPVRSPTGTWPCTIPFPAMINPPPNLHEGERRPDSYRAEVVLEDRVFDAPLDGETAWRHCEEVMRTQVRSKDSYFKLACYQNLSVNVTGIRSTLDSWQLSGWTPDVIIIDYADNLSPVDHRKDVRDQVNETWKHLRAISQSFHCLLVTASQVNAAGFGKYWLDRSNFSEDNRKLSHVTAMVGINMTAAEKEVGLHRLNYIVRREGEFSSRKGVHVASCLSLGCPAVRSTW